MALLKGENQTSKPQQIATSEPITPQITIVSPSAEPISEPRQSTRTVPGPNYWLLNDPAAKEQALVRHEVIVEPQRYREAI